MLRSGPKLIRFVAFNSAFGILIGWFLAAAIFVLDVGGLGSLFMRSDHKFVVTAIIAMSSGVTFGFAYLATAMMLLPTSKDEFDKY